LADLFLDTLPINAHTTTSDALWAGLPVLTCAGSTFAGRVAGSLLKAANLPELITYSLEDYEALALQLAQNPAQLLELRQKLESTRLQVPLFDIVKFTKNLEKIYQIMWDIWQAGDGPKAFTVS
jgi:predicted O-linked N-acetylglucosamine transferase (SPINDLY family)